MSAMRKPATPHPNERVEFAYRILGLRHELRRLGWDQGQADRLRFEMERLEQQLREIDE